MIESALNALKWRCIGPPRGGRVVAVAGHPTKQAVFYFGACAGGVWKTEDAGQFWENVSDGYFNSAAVGAIVVSESDPNVIYAGAGEHTIRGDVSYGDGVYKSTDGGKTWINVGLEETRHIAKIRIHPQNPDLVYVAALGHAFGPNEERGLFRSKDGGQTWEQVLYRDEKAGAIDLSMDPTNPRVLYATFWETVRNFWSLSSGGPGSGIFKSTDGGDSWSEITHNPGLPDGLLGRMGIAVSPANSSRVWAVIEARDERGGVYRSDDGGATWQQLTANRDLIQRPWYYCHIYAHPTNAETVYILNLKMWKSTDGGKTYSEISTPHGDNHDLWIDPANPERMIEGNDGGACVSFNGGGSWSTIYNQLTGQFYHIDVDTRYPYHVYGTQQDNSSISVPSATEKGAIHWTDCYPAGTGESGYIAVNPDDPNIVFVGAVGSSPGGGGALQRYDHRTRRVRLVTVWPEMYIGWGVDDIRYRFPWTFPITFSPRDSGVLYTAGNHVFRSTDEGGSWEPISPDLTRDDKSKFGPSGGPITLDTSGAEHYGTISCFHESSHIPGLLWAGSDDGLLHVSKDNGETWTNITPPMMPEWSYITCVESSPHDPATVYISATRYKLDEYHPYLYKTADYGQSWTELCDGLPETEITRVIREDPARKGLLYVGTETGIFVSFDDGQTWQRMGGNLPVVPVYDMLVRNNDLVVGTHGRAFWILDDLTLLHQLTGETAAAEAYLFKSRDTVRDWRLWGVYAGKSEGVKNYRMSLGMQTAFYERVNEYGQAVRRYLDVGENPPDGAIIHYHLKAAPEADISLTILDAKGSEVKTFSGQKDEKDEKALRLTAHPGLNRFVWDGRYPDAVKVPNDFNGDTKNSGPLAVPGHYQTQLKVGDVVQTQPFNIVPDPGISASQADLQAQFDLWLQIRDKISETHQAVIRIRRIKEQVNGWAENLKESHPAVAEAADALTEKLKAIEVELIQTEANTAGDRLRLKSRLNAKLNALISVVGVADFAPTRQSYEVFEHLSNQVDGHLAQLQTLIDGDVAAFSRQVKETGVPAIVV